MTSLLLFASLLALFGPQLVFGEMTAWISMAGVEGSVTLSRETSNQSNAVLAESLVGGSAYTTVDLYTYPAVFGRTKTAVDVCKNGLGLKIKNLLNPGSAGTTIVGLAESEYYHRSIVLSSTTNPSLPKVCGTLVPNQVTSYRAKFMGPVTGTVWLRYTAGVGTFIFGDLVFSDGRAASEMRNLNLYTGSSIDDTGSFAQRCSQLTTPINVASNISVQTSVSTQGTFGLFSSSITTFTGSLGLSNNNVLDACAILRSVSTKTVTAMMDWNGVKGSFMFTQNSPFERTKISVNVTGLKSAASGFHVHKYPVAQRLSAAENPCDAAFVSGHFNPYNVDINTSPTAGDGTNDQYEIGDLSGKFGTFAGLTDDVIEHYDMNLPLWGRNSIVGRSVVIHRTDGSRLTCGTIGGSNGYSSPVFTTGIVVFKAPVYGTMYFRQDSTNPDEDTSVFVELASQSKTETLNHNWHVHLYPVEDDAYTTADRCKSAGGHYNPAGVNVTDPPYKTECNVEDPLRCELGDLSGRLGGLKIAMAQRTEGGKFFFTDEYLHLSGPFSVLGRSVVVHGPSAAAARFACGNITQLHPIVAKTGTWTGKPEGTVTGQLTLNQPTEFDVTKVSGSFNGLASLASGYHIHEFSISPTAAAGSECEVASVAGHYNPFNWTAATPATTGTSDEYEVGDLSNKYGLLDGETQHIITANTLDSNLPLFTFLASTDKSLVIHKKEAGARWKCANLYTEPATGSNGYVISATVSFSTTVTGTIKLRQIIYEDAGAGLTSYDVNVNPKSGSSTLQHNWHIHIDPITDQASCAVALGHYDPYGAADNTDYSTDCKPANPLFCEVGDISAKQGKYDIGGGRKTFHDVDTPMHTNFSVLGRSIVFHEANGGSPRYTCANIIPDDFTYTISFPASAVFDRYSFTKTVSSALGISRLRVVIIHNIDVPVVKNGCSRVMIHVAGGGSLPASTLNNLVAGTLSGMSTYQATAQCENKVGAVYLGQKSGATTKYVFKYLVAHLSFVVTILLSRFQ